MKTLPLAYSCVSKSNYLKKIPTERVFLYICSYIVNKYRGVIYGSVVDCDKIYHSRAETIDEVTLTIGNKCARSDLKNTFSECCEDLKNDRWVLYSGTPCQINALHFYLKNKDINLDKLVIVDVICHGTPKIEYWREYLKNNFPNQKSPVNFRYKKKGWEDLLYQDWRL